MTKMKFRDRVSNLPKLLQEKSGKSQLELRAPTPRLLAFPLSFAASVKGLLPRFEYTLLRTSLDSES